MIKVMIADDHEIVREGLKQVLNEYTDIQVCAEASNGVDTIKTLRDKDFNVLILDLSLPDRTGLDIIKTIKNRQQNLGILIFSIHDEVKLALRLIKAGASGYLTKDSSTAELIEAIRKIALGGKYVSKKIAEYAIEHISTNTEEQLHTKLTNREFQVMSLLSNGITVSNIAKKLNLSVKTISTYRSRILDKLQLKSTADIIKYVLKNNLAI